MKPNTAKIMHENGKGKQWTYEHNYVIWIERNSAMLGLFSDKVKIKYEYEYFSTPPYDPVASWSSLNKIRKSVLSNSNMNSWHCMYFRSVLLYGYKFGIWTGL